MSAAAFISDDSWMTHHLPGALCVADVAFCKDTCRSIAILPSKQLICLMDAKAGVPPKPDVLRGASS